MRVEHDGEYALVASMGGAPQNPVWYYNLKADPTALMIQDGPQASDYFAQEVAADQALRITRVAVVSSTRLSEEEYRGRVMSPGPYCCLVRLTGWS